MQATLELLVPGRGAQQHLMVDGVWRVGREAGDLVISHGSISGSHGELLLDSAGLSYRDLGSTNGSYWEQSGERLTGSVKLAAGAALRLGQCTLRVLDLSLPTSIAPTAALPAFPESAQLAPAEARSAMTAGASAAPPPRGSESARGVGSTGASAGTYSHPGARVRHSYPLAIGDAGLATAFSLFMKTLPYAIARFGILVAASLLTILWFIIAWGGAAFLASKVQLLGVVWGVAGTVAYGWVWRTVVRYFLYMLKLGQIAVLTELITTGSVRNGEQGMFEYGKAVVTQRFGEANAMFVLDRLIHGVVRAFNRTLNWIANLLPIPGLGAATSIANKVLYAATTYVDETLFSYNLARGDENVFRSSQDGLIYYAQNCKEVLKTGAYIVVLDYVLTFVAWLVMLLPAFLVALLVPGASSTGVVMVLVAVLFASNVRAAFLHPLFLTMVMIKFHVSVQNQGIDESWDQKLSQVSDKFRQIKDKAFGERRDEARA